MRSSLATPSPSHGPSEAANLWLLEPSTPRREPTALGPIALLLAAFFAVIVFFPPEGRVAGPLHDLIAALLGRATFMLPLALSFVGVLSTVRTFRPAVRLPRRRLSGVALIALAVAASEQLLGNGRDGTGLLGEWLSASLLDLFGMPFTVVLLVVVLGAGILLAFNISWPKPVPPPPHAES